MTISIQSPPLPSERPKKTSSSVEQAAPAIPSGVGHPATAAAGFPSHFVLPTEFHSFTMTSDANALAVVIT